MRKGFTLIELMMVIAIIAILVGIALPRFKGMQEQANMSKAEGEVRALKTAIESWNVNKGYYLGDGANCTLAGNASINTPCATCLTNSTALANSPRTPQVIDAALDDPFTAASDEYYYRYQNSGYYAVCSRGPDGGIDVAVGELSDGQLTSAEIDDDICAGNVILP